MEIERQFLVDRLPQLPEEYELLRQGYVALLPEIRIRQIGDSHFRLTVKRGAGLVREEWETEVSRQEFESLSERLCPGTCMIEKRRYKIPLADGLVAELHVHAGHLTGFNYVEVEFSDVEGAKKFVPPTWFGREVTDDVRFSYGTLAQARGMDIVREILQSE
ncbi:CYTH domain-containing protein [Selenomonas ruminantium]|uniref:CYTH domain-containing protein n=1 Tax=Selenomonas ruminantium TaxID=971 RepID=A0A1K1PDE9_SELRU|nr:CYTH domain-containing protein [Selenomonas ruminantium]SFW45485.1 CYTH domain-containing protein [Selenomonas ruminantium]